MLTVLLSWYLSLTIARPILRLAGAAARDARGPRPRRQRAAAAAATGATRWARWPRRCRIPPQALFARMDAIEQFAADVAHEIKNPLSSIRSAIETLRRIEDPERQQPVARPSSRRT